MKALFSKFELYPEALDESEGLVGNTASEGSRGETVDLDPQPAAWHQWSGTSPGLGPPPTQALEASPGQRTPYAALRPEQNLALWRAQSASGPPVTFIFHSKTQRCCLTGTSVPTETKGSGVSVRAALEHLCLCAYGQRPGVPPGRKGPNWGRGDGLTPLLVWTELCPTSPTPTSLLPRLESR